MPPPRPPHSTKLFLKAQNIFSDFRKDRKEDQHGQISGHDGTWCGQLTGSQSFRDGAQLSHVHSAVFQVLAAVLHLFSSNLSPSTCFFNSSPTSSTERQGPVRLATQGSCQKDSDPLASLSLCLAEHSLSGSIKAAFWKLIWKGGTSGGTWSGSGKERGRDGGRAGEGKGQGGVMRECDSEWKRKQDRIDVMCNTRLYPSIQDWQSSARIECTAQYRTPLLFPSSPPTAQPVLQPVTPAGVPLISDTCLPTFPLQLCLLLFVLNLGGKHLTSTRPLRLTRHRQHHIVQHVILEVTYGRQERKRGGGGTHGAASIFSAAWCNPEFRKSEDTFQD